MGYLFLDITCPHCLRDNAVLTAFGEVQKSEYEYSVGFLCRSCKEPTVANIRSHSCQSPTVMTGFDGDISIPGSRNFTLIDYFPEPGSDAAPANTPDRAARFFIEATENLRREKFETSVMLCRKVLDIATRVILGDESNKEQLSQRISMLHGKGKITEQMKDWAHIVRIDSNGAVHSDEEFTNEEAEDMIGFTEMFLIYAFTLPFMVEERQKRHAK